jgi:hypothetical protein
MGNHMKKDAIALSDYLEGLRRELSMAYKKRIEEKAAGSTTPDFLLRRFDVEIEIVSESSGSAKGNIEFWVASVGAGGEHKKQKSQRLVLYFEIGSDGPLTLGES